MMIRRNLCDSEIGMAQTGGVGELAFARPMKGSSLLVALDYGAGMGVSA